MGWEPWKSGVPYMPPFTPIELYTVYSCSRQPEVCPTFPQMGQSGSFNSDKEPPEEFPVTSYLRAAKDGQMDYLLWCLSSPNSNVDVTNKFSLTALHLAAKEGNENIVRELLHRDANPNITTKRGNSPLHIAAVHGQHDICHLLIANGAAVDAQCKRGYTPLYLAVMENHRNVVSLLLSSGANSSLAPGQITPLRIAEVQGYSDVVALLKRKTWQQMTSVSSSTELSFGT